MAKKNVVALELSRIAKAHGGKLLPEDVVEAAKPKSSPLHSKFTWDDTVAAHQHRLWQARQLISVTVLTVVGKKTQMFVSLTKDRHEGNGYRHVVDVLNDEQLTAQLLEDAKAEMRYFAMKYRKLTALAKVVEAMDEVLRKPSAAAATAK
jgi:hypothetical protein